MRRLYHYTLSAPSRAVRFALAEKGLDVELRPEEPWARRPAFLRLNPAGEVPVLVDEKSTAKKRGQQAIPLGEEGDPPAPEPEAVEEAAEDAEAVPEADAEPDVAEAEADADPEAAAETAADDAPEAEDEAGIAGLGSIFG